MKAQIQILKRLRRRLLASSNRMEKVEDICVSSHDAVPRIHAGKLACQRLGILRAVEQLDLLVDEMKKPRSPRSNL